MIRKVLYHPFFIRLFHWEYWPFHVVYGPLYIYWLMLCARCRSFFFFNTANPSIINGGFLMESKKAIYDLLPQKYYPKTLLFKAGCSRESLLLTISNQQFHFPLVGKPDIGMQGKAVKKLNNVDELLAYALHSKVDFLVQEFVAYENELGIFYYRYPDEERGCISGIVEKEFLTVTGNGISSIEELLLAEKRFVLQLATLKKTYGEKLNSVLPPGEKFLLVPYGNHVRGAKFLNVSHLADERLVNVVDEVCRQVQGFYFGRLDIRYNTLEELKEGKNFSIIELNGAGSEPTHMYDPKHSIFFAWREIVRHWNILSRISRINHRLLQKPYMKMMDGLEMLKANKRYVKLIDDHEQQRA